MPTHSDIDAVRQEVLSLRKDMENREEIVLKNMDDQEERLRRDIDVLKSNVNHLRWLFGIIAAAVGLEPVRAGLEGNSTAGGEVFDPYSDYTAPWLSYPMGMALEICYVGCKIVRVLCSSACTSTTSVPTEVSPISSAAACERPRSPTAT
jgi:hypothetical protein